MVIMLNFQLKYFVSWLGGTKFALNGEKTKLIIISPHNKTLPRNCTLKISRHNLKPWAFWTSY